jgi:Tat protein secretion system quality control protein TatD with DNase activity
LADRVALVPRENLLLETNDPYMNIFDVVDHYLQHLTGNIRYTPIIVGDNRNQFRHPVQTLRLDKTELGQPP